jgi:lambda family phage minor tail protein L
MYDVTSTFLTESARISGGFPITMYCINASYSGHDHVYYTDLNQNIYGWNVNNSGEVGATETLYYGVPIDRGDFSSNVNGELSDVSISIPNTDRVVESYIQNRRYLRGCNVYIITTFAKYLPSGSSANHVGSDPDHNAIIKEKFFIDGTSSNESVVTFSCKSKLSIKNVTIPGRVFYSECAWAMGIGAGYLGTECLLPNEQVTIQNYTTKEIQDIEIGDKILDHNGNFESVNNIIINNYDDEIVSIKAKGLKPINVTKNHPIYIARDNKDLNKLKDTLEFVKANDLKVGDYVCIPINRYTQDIKILDLAKIIRKIGYPYLLHDNETKISLFRKYADTIKINRFIDIDSDFLKLVGYYLAEGSATKKYLSFAFHKDEIFDIDFVLNTINNKFGILGFANKRKDNCTECVIRSKLLSIIFEYFGSSISYRKKICDELIYLDPDLQMDILYGVFRGDGSIKYSRGKSVSEISMATTSNRLAWQIIYILLRNNIFPSTKNNPKYYYTNYIRISGKPGKSLIKRFFGDNYPFSNSNLASRTDTVIYLDNCALVQIKNIDRYKYSGEVYNLEINNSHSFVVGGIATHNCDPNNTINSTTYPTCDGTLDSCKTRNNISRFGGFPGVPKSSIIV